MIDPHWRLEDLDPRTWRNLGRFFDPGQFLRAAQPGENELFVLHDRGQVLRVVDTCLGVRDDVVSGFVNEPVALAQELHQTNRWRRVHVVDKQHLAQIARAAQRPENRALTLDAYYYLVYELLWKTEDGYVAVPPHPGHWHGWTYRRLRDFVRNLAGPATLALGVLSGPDGDVHIGLVIEMREGLIRRVTTFEALRLEAPLSVSAGSLERLWSALSAQIAPPVGILLCTPAVFEAWLTAADKLGVLQAAAQQGAACWKLEPISA